MIAIAGGKGGCGKTTTTLGLARALVRRGVPVRAVDLDRGMPDLHRLAGVDREPTLADAVAGPECVSCSARRTEAGVEIVPAPRTTVSLDVERALGRARHPVGVALLDCPAGAGPRAAEPMRAADAVVLVTTGRAESVEDASKTASMARSLGVSVLGGVVTRCRRPPESVEAALETQRLVGVPEAAAPLSDEAVRRQYGRVADWITRARPRVGSARRD